MKEEKRYIVDTKHKPEVREVTFNGNTVMGDYWDRSNSRHISGCIWNLSTLKCVNKENIPDIIIYKYREFYKNDVDWSIFPIDCNYLGRDEDGIDGSVSGLRYQNGTMFDYLGQYTYIGTQDIYNFNILDLEEGEQIEKPKEQEIEFDPIKEAIQNGDTRCHCGSMNTRPFTWNGQFQGFKCSSCSTEMAYELLT